MSEQSRAGHASRRSFLKASAAAVSAAALSPLDIPPVHAGGSGTIRIGMIGCGGRCRGATDDAMGSGPDVQLVAMADIFDGRLQGALKHLKGSRKDQVKVGPDQCFVGFDGYKKVIDLSDAVLIACASKFHARYAREALEAGKHVFVEKPHAIDTAGIKVLEEAVRLAAEKKLCLVSGLHSRYDLVMQEAMKRVHDGAIGEIVSIEENFLRAPYVLVQRQPGMKEIEYQFSNWYHFCWLSGDDVTQSLVHNVDRATWGMKGLTPVKAHGLGGRSSSFGEIYGDMFDHHSAVYEYANGVRMYAFCRTQKGCYNEYSSILLGSKGRCNLMGGVIQGETNWRYQGRRESAHRLVQTAYMEAVRSGKVLNNSEYMVKSTQVAILGQVACYTGKEVTWDQLVKSDFSFGPRDGSFETEPPIKPGPDGNYPIAVPGQTKLV